MSEQRAETPIELGAGVAVGRLVVPVTLDQRYDRGVSAAAALAERFGLPVLLVCVDLGDESVGLDQGELMRRASAALVAAHPSVEVGDLVLGGTAEPAAVLAAQLEPGDLVVLATEAMDDPSSSFAQHLASHSHAPVLMIGPVAELGALEGDVVVAVDGSVLAERCIPAARGFAAALGSNIKLVEAVSSVVSAHVHSLKERGERVSENAYIRDLADRLDDPRVSWEVVHHDDPAAALGEASRRTDVAMIVMSTHGRDGFVGQVFGSIALDTVRQARCPVLVQRPVAEPQIEISG